ncbi:hypothetical protein IL306_009013 [Fusarium sp. DS 682]|nr:hypothetical protein IL306_009013 [Fusarium sp. DS 682]
MSQDSKVVPYVPPASQEHKLVLPRRPLPSAPKRPAAQVEEDDQDSSPTPARKRPRRGRGRPAKRARTPEEEDETNLSYVVPPPRARAELVTAHTLVPWPGQGWVAIAENNLQVYLPWTIIPPAFFMGHPRQPHPMSRTPSVELNYQPAMPFGSGSTYGNGHEFNCTYPSSDFQLQG